MESDSQPVSQPVSHPASHPASQPDQLSHQPASHPASQPDQLSHKTLPKVGFIPHILVIGVLVIKGRRRAAAQLTSLTHLTLPYIASDFTQNELIESDLRECHHVFELIESDLTQSELIESDLTQSELTGSDLTQSELIQSDVKVTYI